MKENICQPRFLSPAKLLFKSEGNKNISQNELRESRTHRLSLKEILKYALQKGSTNVEKGMVSKEVVDMWVDLNSISHEKTIMRMMNNLGV